MDNNYGQYNMMYKLMIILSLASGLAIAALLQHRKKVPAYIIAMSLMLNIMLILQGAIFTTLILSKGEGIGLNSSGAALGMIIGILIFSLIAPQYRKAFMESYITVLPLMYGIGKIGCSFAGCCYGMAYSGPLAMTDAEGISRFPIQPLEAIVFILAFVLVLTLDIRKRLTPLLAGISFVTIKIVLDFLRESHQGHIVTSNQLMCIFIIAFCIIAFKYISRGDTI